MSYPSINYITKISPKPYGKGFCVRFCFIACLLFVFIYSHSQNSISVIDFVPPLDTLQRSIIKFHRESALAELENYNYKTRANWLRYIPSPGWNFVMNSPVISYNFSDVADAINAKHIRKATVNAIIQTHTVEMNSAWSELVILRESLISKIQAYNGTFDLLTLYKKKFEIVEKGFAVNEVTPSDYLNAKLVFASFYNSLQKEFSTLVQLRNELLIKSKKGVRISLFDNWAPMYHSLTPH